jgi:hypothetical protein
VSLPRPPLDPELYARLYAPPVPHEAVAESADEYGVRRIRVDGVTVRYVEDAFSVQMTVEGDLPAKTLDALIADLHAKLSALENAPCEIVPL